MPPPLCFALELKLDSTNILREVVQETNQAVGPEYFRSLVRSLANALGVTYCFVTQCVDQPPSRVRTLAFWTGGDFAASFEYALLNTPCEAVIHNGTCPSYGSNIQALFPQDQDLVNLGAESYAAVPLAGSSGDILGHLVVLGTQPFEEPAPDLSILELFAARAAAELERQQATTELANSEARLRQVIDLVPHYIFAKDTEGRFILANQAVADAYQASVSDLIGKTDGDFSATEEQVERFRRDDLEVIQSGRAKTTIEEAITDASGKVRLLQTTKIPFYVDNSEQPAVLGVSTDTTELRRAESALRSIVEGTADTVGDAFFRSLTRHLAKALGTHYAILAEFEGDHVRTMAAWGGDGFLDPVQYPLAGSPCQRVLMNQARTFFPEDLQQLFPEHSLVAKLGAQSYLGTPLFDVDQRPIGLLAVLDLQPLGNDFQNNQLLSVFASRAAAEIQRKQLEDRQQKLQSQVLHVQKLESLGVLAGGIAHDFNNLLCAIVGNAELGAAKLHKNPPDGVSRHLQEIMIAAKRSTELTHQMLAYSGHGNFVIARIDLNRLIEEMSDLLSVSVSKKAQIHLELGEDLPLFEGDGTQIRQVVMNLIINGSDAIGEMPGTVQVRTGVCDADRALLDEAFLADQLPEGRYVFIEVEDDGCGMDEQTLERLFDPFFTTKDTGRGLGLAALLGIVRGHQGAVKVQSSPGEGSIFTVLLQPCESQSTETIQLSPTLSSEWKGSGKVLLADDEPLVRLIIGQMLEHLGFEVLLAENGCEALEVFREQHREIRAVVLDMMMPELDGLEAFQAMRQLDPAVKVLLASGFSKQSIPAPFEEGGVDGFLQKPIRLEQLRDKLREMLQ